MHQGACPQLQPRSLHERADGRHKRGRRAEIDKALGAPCLLNLEQRESKTGNQYNSIRDIVPPVDGVEIAQARTPLHELRRGKP